MPVEEWVSSLTERAPHLFDIANAGGGAPKNPAGAGTGGKKSMTRAAFDALPHHERPAAIRDNTITD
jgi:hypothetical protein